MRLEMAEQEQLNKQQQQDQQALFATQEKERILKRKADQEAREKQMDEDEENEYTRSNDYD